MFTKQQKKRHNWSVLHSLHSLTRLKVNVIITCSSKFWTYNLKNPKKNCRLIQHLATVFTFSLVMQKASQINFLKGFFTVSY